MSRIPYSELCACWLGLRPHLALRSSGAGQSHDRSGQQSRSNATLHDGQLQSVPNSSTPHDRVQSRAQCRVDHCHGPYRSPATGCWRGPGSSRCKHATSQCGSFWCLWCFWVYCDTVEWRKSTVSRQIMWFFWLGSCPVRCLLCCFWWDANLARGSASRQSVRGPSGRYLKGGAWEIEFEGPLRKASKPP